MAKPTTQIRGSFPQLSRGMQTSTSVSPEFMLKVIEVPMLEMEDVLFHLDSAVMMPEKPKGKSSADGTEDDATDSEDAQLQQDQDRVSGIEAVALALKQFEFDPNLRLLIAGHTDTSGAPKMNFELSEQRAQNVLHLLEGNREPWAEVSEKRHRIEDYQQILVYVKSRRGWDCDPGSATDSWNQNTSDAIKKFIEAYNNDLVPSGLAAKGYLPIPVDTETSKGTHTRIKEDPNHKWRIEMWRAVYDIYNDEIAKALGVDRDGLSKYRSVILFVDPEKKYLSCGESYPIDDAEKGNYRSQVNRRVELYFFDPEHTLVIDCPPPRATEHKAPECPMWHRYHFKRKYIDGADLKAVVYHLRFAYYHPLYAKLESVPDGLQIKVTENGSQPLTASSKYKDGVYYLKVSYRDKLVDPARRTLHFAFEAPQKWVYKANADDSGKIVTDAEMQAALQALRDKKQNDVEEKWKYYDLPAKWLSDYWCVRSENQSGGGVTDDDIKNNKDKKQVFRALFSSASPAPAKFKPFGAKLSQPDKPLVFSLDDLVLTDENLAPVTVADMQRVAILDEKFAVIDPDSANHRSYYTAGVAGSASANGNITGLMISGYLPYFGKPVHGVVAQNRLHAAFKDRVTAGGQRTGHRALVYKHKTKSLLVTSFQQRHYRVRENKTEWSWSIGNFDCYLLREQGFESGEEISYVFSYFRWHLKDKDTTHPAATPTWIDDSIKNIVAAWNDEEVAGQKLVSLAAAHDTAKERVYIRFYIQHVPEGEQHTIVLVNPPPPPPPAVDNSRSFMTRDHGEIKANQTKRPNPAAALVAAHEYGHASSLDDDYHERWNNCCYKKPGCADFKLGAPYDYDETSMMRGNFYTRARHYWHYAEWLRSRLISGKKLDFVVAKTGNPDYKIPFHPSPTWDPTDFGTDADHYYNYPTKQANNQINSVSGKGSFNLYLYPLGDDDYSQAVPQIGKKFTALLIVKVNLRFQFWDPLIGASATFTDIFNALDRIERSIALKFTSSNVLKICGDPPYTETLVVFQPRYLVNNYVSNYGTATPSSLDTSGKYSAKRNWILDQPEAQPHYEIDVDNDGTSEWDDYDDTPGELDLAVGDANEFWKYFAEMVGLAHGQVPTAANFAVGNFVPNGTVQLA